MDANIAYTHKRIVIFIAALFILMAVALCTPSKAEAVRDYAVLCSKYESSNNPVSAVKGEAYGAYQFTPYNAYRFTTWLISDEAYATDTVKNKTSLKSTYKTWNTKLKNAYVADGNACGTQFTSTWKGITLKEDFFNAQYDFCRIYYYDEAVTLWKKYASDFRPNIDYSVALRNVIFSTAIQHGTGGSASIFKKALEELGGWKKGLAEDKLIVAIYNERARTTTTAPGSYAIKITTANLSGYSSALSMAQEYGLIGKYLSHFYGCSAAVQVGVYNRLYVNEKRDAVKMFIEKGGTCGHYEKTGGITTYTNMTDKTYTAKTSAKTCAFCDKVYTKAKSVQCTASYTMSGALWRDKTTGRSITIHATNHHYAVTATSLNLRASASASSTIKLTLSKGNIVKITSAVMGSDGFWWGKLTRSGKTGYVQMRYLSYLGNASSAHSYDSQTKKCAYCGCTSSQVALHEPGTYVASIAMKARKNAYSSSTAVSSIAAKSTVTVVSVHVNRYNYYWGKLSDGTYVNMRYLQICTHSTTTGGKVSYTNITDTTHVVSTSAKTCKTCGKVIKKASTVQVDNSFVMNGEKWTEKDCGRSLTIHAANHSYATTTGLNLRSKAATSGTLLTTIPKDTVVKVVSRVTGSDGYWWGKVTYSSKTGYVQMRYLSYLGPASLIHKYSATTGKCIYCGCTKEQVANKSAGTYKASQDIAARKNAYGTASKVNTITAGSTVKVQKVVVNLYNFYWGMLADGTYVNMSFLSK